MIFFCSLIFVACGSKKVKIVKEDDKLSELRLHLEERLKVDDPANKLDSFKLIRIDSLTQRDKFNFLNEALTDSLKRIKLRMEVYSELYKANLKLANLSKRRSTSQDSVYKAEAEENKKEFEKFEDETKHLESQLLYYDSLLKVCDTVKAIGYEAICLYQLRRKDRSVLNDTGYVLMKLNKDIVRREDFVRLP